MVHRYLRLLPLLLSVLTLLAFGGFVPRANAAELAPTPAGAAEKHEALSLKAEPLFTLGKFTVTNSMVAMKNATDNANQFIKHLTLEYNKMRQASITTELLEIATAQMAVGG